MPTSTLNLVILNEGMQTSIQSLTSGSDPILNPLVVCIFVGDISISKSMSGSTLINNECADSQYSRIAVSPWITINNDDEHPKVENTGAVMGPFEDIVDAYGIFFYNEPAGTPFAAVKFPTKITIPVGQTLIVDTTVGLRAATVT